MLRGARTRVLGAVVVFAVAAVTARAQVSDVGRSLTLPDRPPPHAFWVSDILLHRTALFDGDTGELRGTISSGTAGVGFVIFPLRSPDRPEIYIPETYYERGVRGARTDVVTVYDARTLAPVHEIGIPPKRAEYFPGNAASALSDDGRFLAVFNLTPVTSLSIVDVVARRFTSEVPTPGCSLVFAAGPRRFFMLCANGAALTVDLDDGGQPASISRGQPFFDPQNDPLTEKAVRRGSTWLFVSFEGYVQPIDVAGGALAIGERWSLFDEADRKASWRIGGQQHLAVHAASGRLYALVHQGGPDTHKQPGTEIWVYDLGTRKRVQRIETLNPLVSFIAQQGALSAESFTGRMSRWALGASLPHTGIDNILVTQDDDPVLIAAGAMPPTVTVHDAMTGAVRREISEVGLGISLLFAP
ncbi:MAG TPA: amine dehydrogenase large subunit [Candidatus Limnocylindria bacterium]|nr:amine dehydrogenase large subunit [Candidatus Limnocylindria bacterium]